MRGGQPIFRGILAVGIVGVPLLLGGFAARPHESKPAEITVVGADYAFAGIPQQIRAGRTLFSFKNAGKVRHELVAARLESGTTVDQVIQRLKNGAAPRDVINAGGLLFAKAGETSPVQLSLNLIRGEKYMIYCNFQDTLNAPRHWALGMYSGFTVK